MKRQRTPLLADLVRRRRAALGLTNKELAARCKISKEQIAHIQSRRHLVAAWRVRTFAKALGVSVDTLLASIERTHSESGVLR